MLLVGVVALEDRRSVGGNGTSGTQVEETCDLAVHFVVATALSRRANIGGILQRRAIVNCGGQLYKTANVKYL